MMIVRLGLIGLRNKRNDMEYDVKKIKKIVTVVVSLLVLIIMIAAIKDAMTAKRLDLYNIDQVNIGLSGSEISDLEKYIWQKLKGTYNYDDDKAGVIALIRPSSFEKKRDNIVDLYRFLIDIDEFRATYEVSFGLVEGQGFYESPTIACPLPSQMKYPEESCVGRQMTTTKTIFEFELPYSFRLENGEYVTVTSKYSTKGQEYLNIEISSCGDTDLMNEAEARVKEWLISLEYDPDDYEIVVPEFCDGSF
ncbi:MAG: hypothetical protein U0L97_05205 [Candidatus Saccharimonadaceae bacterium]|nr:hypothetical protein [Candidatus Saccharimonadaceae bacterium]